MMAAPELKKDYSILIADDDRNSRDALREIFQPAGFDTHVAASGEEAIDIVLGRTIHLVVLDMHMPTLTGMETLRVVRQINASLPAILVTGDPSESLVRQAIQAQFYSVIPKPVSRHLLMHTVLKALMRSYGLT